MDKIIEVNGETYVKHDTGDEALRIIVVDNRGLTFVGRCPRPSKIDVPFFTIRGARCVIRWGTTSHLAQLAETGPTSNTLLGHAADVEVAVDAVVISYICNESEWADE